MDRASMLHELAPTVEQLMHRHLATTKEWFPHEHIPYGRGRDFDDAEPWCAEAADLGGGVIDDAVRSSLIVNLLTEDNLPYYFRTIERELGDDGPRGASSERGSPGAVGGARGVPGRGGGPPRRAATRWRSTAT